MGQVKVPVEKLPEVGVPKRGVTNVGLVANTIGPDPVSSVIAANKLALDGVARNVAIFAARPLTPVEIGNPVTFVATKAAGVPNPIEFPEASFPFSMPNELTGSMRDAIIMQINAILLMVFIS